jgi:hypothetical protein
LLEERFLRVLRIIIDRLEGRGIDWALSGSSNLALQGMNLTPKDIDIITTKEGAYEIANALKEFMIEPVEFRAGKKLASYHGRALIEGIGVEIIGEFKIKGAYLKNLKHAIRIKVGDLSIPCFRLEDEYRGYLKMGRKALRIKEFLEKSLN